MQEGVEGEGGLPYVSIATSGVLLHRRFMNHTLHGTRRCIGRGREGVGRWGLREEGKLVSIKRAQSCQAAITSNIQC